MATDFDRSAASQAFGDYQSRKAANTLRRQRADLSLFATYLATVGVEAGDLAADPRSWAGVTWGLVASFVQWMLQQGYAVGSVNVRLSTVKTYARLAAKAGILDAEALALIRTVQGYAHGECRRVDEKREAAGVATRLGRKKAMPVSLDPDQARRLKKQPETPRGRRDALIMALLLDHGLRVGELARLSVGDLDLEAGEVRFYRPKVNKWQTHRLTADTLQAARAYLQRDAPPLGPLLRASRKGRLGFLAGAGLSARRIAARVKALGRAIHVDGLSPHDCRHYWATQAARCGTPIDRLQDAGGWSSLSMPLHYIRAATVANDGVRLE
jgi:integrase